MTPTLTFRLTGVVADLDETTPGEREHPNFALIIECGGGLCADRRADERLAVEKPELPGVDGRSPLPARVMSIDSDRVREPSIPRVGYWIVTTSATQRHERDVLRS
jgi:hypothetical protein